MRAFLVSVFVVVAIVLVPFADLGVWVQRELVGTASFVNLGEQVLQQQSVRDALARQIAETGVNYLVCRFAFGDMALAESQRSLELFTRHVMGELASPTQ